MKKKMVYGQIIIGIIIALSGAVIMFEGNLLGESTTNAAIVIGIFGILLIATSPVRLFKNP